MDGSDQRKQPVFGDLFAWRRHPSWMVTKQTDLACWSGDGVTILNTNGVIVRRIFGAGPFSWSPDGSRIAFNRNGIYTANIDGSDERKQFDYVVGGRLGPHCWGHRPAAA